MSATQWVRIDITTTRTVDISPERLAYLLDQTPEYVLAKAQSGGLTGILRDEIREDPSTAELLLAPGTQPTTIDCRTEIVPGPAPTDDPWKAGP